MFPKRIRLLLNFFDLCGFHTETSKKSSKTGINRIFLIHSVWAFALTCFSIACSMEPMILGDSVPYLVNELLQMMNGLLTYWVMIVESYLQRENQRKFWRIYKYIETFHKTCKRTFLRIYFVKLIEYLTLITMIQIYFTQHFTHYVKHYSLFRICYLFSQIMYQYRVFYFLFYLELIKYELKIIKNELKDVVEFNQFRHTFAQYKRRRSCQYNSIEDIGENTLKRISAYCQLVFELSKCINQIFGWSNFTTVLYSFHLPLTDGNWAVRGLHERAIFIMWMLHLALLIYYLFRGTMDCQATIESIVFYLNELNIDFDDASAWSQIEALMLYLTKNPLIFHAKGLFTISNETLLRFVAALSAYWLFFLQFTQSY